MRMRNNRHYKRYPVKCGGIITDDGFRKYRFQTINMSACGMSFTTDVEIGETAALTVHFDTSGILFPHIKRLTGKIVRKKDIKPRFYYAVRFVELSHMEAVEIDEYLQYRHKGSLIYMADHPVEDTFMAFPKIN